MICYKCKIEKEDILFRKKNFCKDCASIAWKKYYKNNQERLKEKSKKFFIDNKDEVKKKANKYRKNNKEKLFIVKKNYRDNNKEAVKAQVKKWKDANKHHIKEWQSNYSKENPLIKILSENKRRAAKKCSRGSFTKEDI